MSTLHVGNALQPPDVTHVSDDSAGYERGARPFRQRPEQIQRAFSIVDIGINVRD